MARRVYCDVWRREFPRLSWGRMNDRAPSAAANLSNDIAIQVVDAHKTYRRGSRLIPALAGVNLTVRRGEMVAIMGASGSGKSTLLHLLACLDKPDQGAIIIHGRNLAALSEREATQFRRHQVGVIFQQFNLIPVLTVEENVLLPARLAGRDDASTRRQARETLDLLGLIPRLGHRPDALSGGEQQRAAIARALVLRPALLLADEPTGNLDSCSAGQFWALLKQLLDLGRSTVLVVTHEPSAALQAQRVVALRDGVVVGEFDVAPGDNSAALAARYQHLAS